MKLPQFIAAKRTRVAAAMLAAAGLVACGGSGDIGTPVPPSNNPEPVIDAFIAAVSGMVSATSETSEPVAIESYTAPVPDNSEPFTF
jgi:ABC-type glycerol-3-phosphate transport system substrate-binding protein